MRRAKAEACANVALVKHWGDRDPSLNLPEWGSLSITVGALRTETEVVFDGSLAEDQLEVDGTRRNGQALSSVRDVLDQVRTAAGLADRARVSSNHSFPTGTGLAASSSGMASLALAATRAAGVAMSADALSTLARRGAGSATRSVHGGFVEWRTGMASDGSDSHGIQLQPEGAWDVRILLVLLEGQAKGVPPREQRQHAPAGSPYYRALLESVDVDLPAAREAIQRKDLAALGEIAEAHCLRMHGALHGADPNLLFWRGATVEVMHGIRKLRQAGYDAWFTVDAGPHVKVLTRPEHALLTAEYLSTVPGVARVVPSVVGGAARTLN